MFCALVLIFCAISSLCILSYFRLCLENREARPPIGKLAARSAYDIFS